MFYNGADRFTVEKCYENGKTVNIGWSISLGKCISPGSEE
jgi:hypothetical protein